MSGAAWCEEVSRDDAQIGRVDEELVLTHVGEPFAKRYAAGSAH